MRDDPDIQAFLRTFEGAREKAYSENTIAAYHNDLSQFRGHLDAAGLDGWAPVRPEHIAAYIAELRERPYASSTIARKVAAIKSFYHFLVQSGRLAQDPTVGLESPKVKKRLPRALSADAVERLLSAPPRNGTAKALRDRALLELLYATGMRVSEVVAMRLEDVEREAGRVHCPGPGGRSRHIPIDGRALEALNEYLERGRPQLARRPEEQALFLNHRGQKLTRQGLWLIIKEYADQIRLSGDKEKVTPHTLRHSFAAHKLSRGAKLHELQELLGHANISTTQVYSQMKEETDGLHREPDGSE
jgi:integrase/recombinase XerD